MKHSRIVLIGEFGHEVDEGTAVVTRSIANALRRRGHSVRQLSDASNAHTHAVAPSVVLQARRFDPDAVLYIPRAGATRATALKTTFLRRVVRAPAAGVLLLQADANSPFKSFKNTRLLVASREIRRIALSAGVEAAVIPVGVDRTKFYPGGPEAKELWTSSPRVLHVGHLRRQRNLSVLGLLARRGYSCLLVASPSSPPDRALESELRADGVSVIKQHIEDIADVYRAADVFLFPVVEPRAAITMPLSVLEALACGTQVVSTPFGGLPERYGQGHGLYFAPPKAHASAVGALISNPIQVDAGAIPDWDETATAVMDALSIRRRARFVVLLGLDGTGKTTHAQLLAAEASARGASARTVWSRWDPLLLRPIIAVAHRLVDGGVISSHTDGGIEDGDAFTTFKRRLFRSRIARQAWLWAAAADHGMRTLLRLALALRAADIVISDRYYHDALVDIAVGFQTAPPKAHGIYRLFPRPDTVVLLDASEDVLRSRKPDIPSGLYVRHRRPLYLAMARAEGWPIVDAARPLREVQAEIRRHVWSGA